MVEPCGAILATLLLHMHNTPTLQVKQAIFKSKYCEQTNVKQETEATTSPLSEALISPRLPPSKASSNHSP